MSKFINLSVDTLGSETPLSHILKGLNESLERNEEYFFYLYGRESLIKLELQKYKKMRGRSEIINCEEEVLMSDKPADVIKQKKNSSMALAIESVSNGDSHSVLSCGNTGALMALSFLYIKTINEIKRPAIASIWPNLKSESIVLDIGANTKKDARYLIDNALLGSSLASILFKIEYPSVGLLNVGTEENKGDEVMQLASEHLNNLSKRSVINYSGFIEGSDISIGKTNVVVTDGFTGNIALKSAEGTAKMIQSHLKDAFKSSFISQVGYFLSSLAMKSIQQRLDPRIHNCGILAGLNSPVIKCHGHSEYIGISYASDLIYSLIKENVTENVVRYIKLINQKR